jgi:hypothetical protein
LGGRSFTDELEETMTATTLTYIAAREHINDLRREADRHRRAGEVTTPRGLKRSIPRSLARRVGRPATA